MHATRCWTAPWRARIGFRASAIAIEPPASCKPTWRWTIRTSRPAARFEPCSPLLPATSRFPRCSAGRGQPGQLHRSVWQQRAGQPGRDSADDGVGRSRNTDDRPGTTHLQVDHGLPRPGVRGDRQRPGRNALRPRGDVRAQRRAAPVQPGIAALRPHADERLQWIGGLLYFDESASFKQRAQVFVPTTRTFNENRPWGEASNQSLAAYAQLSYALTPSLSVTAGARYNEDRRQLTSRNARRVADGEVCPHLPGLLDQPGVLRGDAPDAVVRLRSASRQASSSAGAIDAALRQAERGVSIAGVTTCAERTRVDMDTFEPEELSTVTRSAPSPTCLSIGCA